MGECQNIHGEVVLVDPWRDPLEYEVASCSKVQGACGISCLGWSTECPSAKRNT